MRTSLIALLPLLLATSAEAGSTLRCGSNLISLDDLASEVEAKCGTPVSQDNLGYREVTDYYGFTQEVLVEEWIYGPKNGMYYYLRLQGNRLVKIESKRGQ